MRRCEFSIQCKEINNEASPQAKEAQTLPAQEGMKPEDDTKDTSHVWISALITCSWSPEREKGEGNEGSVTEHCTDWLTVSDLCRVVSLRAWQPASEGGRQSRYRKPWIILLWSEKKVLKLER